MDRDRRRRFLTAITFLAKPPPDEATMYFRFLFHAVLLLSRSPPDPLMNIRNRLFADDNVAFRARDVFTVISEHRYSFFEMTGETPETLVNLVNSIHINNNCVIISKRNRFLLVFIWLRSYPCYNVLSVMFNISISTVKLVIKRIVTVLDYELQHYLHWPSIPDWNSLRANWSKIPIAIGAIDGTSHEIYRPIENQHQFYSGHRHCIHSQVVIDNTGKIRHIETGFFGHLNDAQQFMLMERSGDELPFPRDCCLLADKIYANRYPVMTPFSGAQLQRKVGDDRRRAVRLNRYISDEIFYQNLYVFVQNSFAEGRISDLLCNKIGIWHILHAQR